MAEQHLTDPAPDGDIRISGIPMWFCPCGVVVWDRAAHHEVSQTLADVVEAVGR